MADYETLAHLLPGVATPGAAPAELDIERLCGATVGFTTCALLASLAGEDFASDAVTELLEGAIIDLTPERQIEVQAALVDESAVRLDHLFTGAGRGSRGDRDVRRDYSSALAALKAAPDGVRSGAAARGYVELVAERFGSDVVEVSFASGRHGARSLRTGEVVALPERAAGAYLVSGAGRRPLALGPFAVCDAGGLLLFRGVVVDELRYVRPGDGEVVRLAVEETRRQLADFMLRTGLYRQALQVQRVLARGERDDPALVHARHAYLGTCHQAAGKHDLAVAEFETAIQSRPDIPVTHYLLCRAYVKLRQSDRAIAVLRTLVESRGRLDKAYELLGDLYHQKGDLEGALKMYSRALVINPLNRWGASKRLRTVEELRRPRVGARPVVEPTTRPVEAPAKTERADRPDGRLIDELLTDLTEEARVSFGPPITGRERELAQMGEILACQRKKNVLLLGDAGVGKTALVEELARRLVAGEVAPHLQGRKLYLMSVATLLAGAKFRGQFEERMLQLVKELAATDCILFVDDFHTIVSAGMSKGGTLDTSNLLKPALVRGDIQCIGATTFDEYRNNVEKDPSLLRCFQLVNVEEPGRGELFDILTSAARSIGEYHKVRFADGAFADTPELVKACLRDRALPDKAIDVLDRAAARAMLRLQRDPDAFPVVTRDDVVQTLADASGIPVEKLAGRGTERLWRIEEALRDRVVGQDGAVDAVARVVRAAKLNLGLRAQRPDGVFLFVGPTGVGKTELARALAWFLFGDEERLIRIDMSEYMERISSSRLIGAAPGYVGYNDQNQLTDLVRRNPYAVVLLDEIEKADAGLMSLFLQVFDAGRLTDGKGRTVHFANTTIVMTSNLGTKLYSRGQLGYGDTDRTVTEAQLMKEIKRALSPEFLNRIDEIVFFDPLRAEQVREIARIQLRELVARFAREGRDLVVKDEVLGLVAREGFDPEYGARNLARTIRRQILEPLADLAVRVSPERWRRARTVVVTLAEGSGAQGVEFELGDEPGVVVDDGTLAEGAVDAVQIQADWLSGEE